MKRMLFTLVATALMTSSLTFAQSLQPTTSHEPGRMDSARANTVNARQVEQQRRIAQGVRSGQLTPRETARLEGREARVHREVRADRTANGGRLTVGERRQVNRQQNRLSRSIYRDKHNNARGIDANRRLRAQ